MRFTVFVTLLLFAVLYIMNTEAATSGRRAMQMLKREHQLRQVMNLFNENALKKRLFNQRQLSNKRDDGDPLAGLTDDQWNCYWDCTEKYDALTIDSCIDGCLASK